jgi:serine/threonine-protein phosphatase 2B regulatory subunit
MVVDNVNDLDLKEMVKRTVRDADKDNDGKLSFEEFQVVMRDEETASKMTIQFSDEDIRVKY